MDYEKLAAELIRALRGKRSQTALSRRLRCKSNVVYSWEAGRRWPTAARALTVASRTGIDLRLALRSFYRVVPPWIDTVELATRAGVALFLDDLRGKSTVGAVAERAGRSRFAVARWLKGEAEPRLPDFLRMVEATSLRLLDFVAVLVDPDTLPSVRPAWRELQAARRAAYELPWSHAVLRVLELEDYRALPQHEPGFIARHLQIEPEEETRCLEALAEAGQIQLQAGRWALRRTLTVDTRQEPERGRRLKAWWAAVTLERLRAGEAGLFSYNLFTVSHADYQRLQDLHAAYFNELRSIVARSQPAERVVLANMQLMSFEGDAHG